jgi:hypothetical protein
MWFLSFLFPGRHRLRTQQCLSIMAVVCGLPVVVTIGQTRPTIPQIVASGGGWIGPTRPSGVGPDVSTLLGITDAIVKGLVGTPLPAYLSADERDVYTDFPIQSATVLFQAAPVGSALPGIPSSIAVTVRGGTLALSGRSLAFRYPGQPELTVGTECVFLLKQIDGKYRLVNDYRGVFAIVANRLTPVGSWPSAASEYRDIGADVAVNRMVASAISQHTQIR